METRQTFGIMKIHYEEWIRSFLESNKYDIRTLCSSATKLMCESFPGLIRVPGWVEFTNGQRLEHWWCEDPEGSVLDPTKSQFNDKIARYVRWVPGGVVRCGRCMECGTDIYAAVESLEGSRRAFCSELCELKFVEQQ